MYRAFLKLDPRTWEETSDFNKVMDHVDEVRIAEGKNDIDDILTDLEVETGLHAYRNYLGTVYLKDKPCQMHFADDDLDRVKAGEAVLCTYLGWTEVKTKGQVFFVRVIRSSESSDTSAAYEGVVAHEVEGGLFEVSYNLELWQSAQRFLVRRRNKDEKNRKLTCNDLYEIHNSIARSQGWNSDKWRLRDTWMIVSAHDGASNRRSTNKLLLKLARKWNSNPAAARKSLSRYMNPVDFDRLDERLSKVTRNRPVAKAA